MALNTYSTGTVTIDSDGAIVVSGGIWSGPNVVAGDMISIDGSPAFLISDVPDETHGQLVGWAGGAVSDQEYVVYKDSSLRFDDVRVAEDASKIVAALNTEGFYHFVPPGATEPDPSLGDEGQYAFQATSGKLWVKSGGVWVFVGVYKGAYPRGVWNSGETYAVNDVVSHNGSSYMAIAENTNSEPPSADWMDLGAAGAAATVDVGTVTTGNPGSAASVTNSGNENAAVLDFTIPRGATVEVGSVTTGAPGSSADVTNSGADGDVVLDFTIPTGKGYGGTSDTELMVGTGNQTFGIEAGLAYVVGDRVHIGATSAPLNWMEGFVTAYSGTSMTVAVSDVGGSGTFDAWGIGLTGKPGAGDGDMKADIYDPGSIAGNAFNGFPVANRTAMAALDTTKFTAVYLTEAGREGSFVWDSSDLSAMVTIDTAQGIYVPPSSDATGASGAWVRKYTGLADVRWFGAALDDTTDDTSAFNVALATVKDVWFPSGRAHVLDLIQVPNGGNLIGDGVARSVFSIDDGFNMSANGVVQMGSSENMSLIDKIGFEFDQPSTGARGDMIQYPPAIYHNDIPRVRIGHVRFSRAWDGIDAGGNAGGATYDWIESGTLHRAITINGSLDTMNLGRFRVWPFGIGSSGDGGTGDVYRDGSNVGLYIGRCDGLAGDVQQFRAIAQFFSGSGSSASRHLASLHLDGDGADLRVSGDKLHIDFLYSTKSGLPTTPAILIDSGVAEVTISAINLLTGGSVQPAVLVNNGTLTINGGKIDARALGKEALFVQATGTLIVRNTELTALGTRTARYVWCGATTATLVVQDCFFPANGGTGDGVQIAASAAGSKISGIVWNGRNLVVSPAYAVGGISVAMGGYVSGDGSTTVVLPDGWTASRGSAGNYAITHNLGWPVSRQHVSAIIHNTPSFDATIMVDRGNSTTNVLRIRTMIGGAATDLDFSFKIEHT